MSASNAAAEPSMEEILSSIRQAINEDIPGAVPETTGDPFASGSSAEAAFSAPPPGQAFDAAVHESHDPFAELTRKLNETRESVQKQMHGVSSNLRSEQPEGAAEDPFEADAQPEPALAEAPAPAPEPPAPAPAPEPAAAPAAKIEEPEPMRAATFSATPQEPPASEAASPPATAGALQALTARVADQQKSAAEAPKPSPEPAPAPTPKADFAAAPPSKPASVADRMSEGTAKSPMPELSWASAERSAPSQPAPLEKPEFIKSAGFDKPAASKPESAPAAKPKTESDPFPKLTAMVERGITETAGSVKTDDAMADLVLRRILEPAIRSWLDDNLPDIVTEIVRDEVRRVASQTN